MIKIKPMKKIVYIDMDNVLVDFQSGTNQLDKETYEKFKDDLDEVPNIFSLMKPMPNAIEAVKELAKTYDVYILSTAPWTNPTAWIDKINWIHKYFGKGKDSILYKRLILSHHKNLNKGDYLIDDRTHNGAGEFEGEHIHFATDKFPDWNSVLNYLINNKMK